MPEIMQAQTGPSFKKWIVSSHSSALFTDPESDLRIYMAVLKTNEEQQTCTLLATIAQHVQFHQHVRSCIKM